MKKLLLLIGLSIFLFYGEVFSQTSYDWDGSTDSDWSTASNWTPSGVPGASDHANITNQTNDPILTTTTTVGSVNLNSGGILTITPGDTLKILDSLRVSATGTPLAGGGVLKTGSSLAAAELIVIGPFASNINVDVKVIFFSEEISLRHARYKRPFSLTYSGSDTSKVNGGNIYDSLAVVTGDAPSATGALYFPSKAGSDIFNYTAEYINNGPAGVFIQSYPSSVTQFRGDASFIQNDTAICIAYNGECEFYKNMSYEVNGTPTEIFLGDSLGSVSFRGGFIQNVECIDCSYEVYDLILDKSSNDINLNSDVFITNIGTNSGSATFVAGKLIIPDSYSITFDTTTTHSNASNNSYVRGIVQKIGDTPFIFPVGGELYYRPTEMFSLSDFTDATLVKVIYSDARTTITDIASGDEEYSINACEYWSVTAVNDSIGAKLRFYFPKPPCDDITAPKLLRSYADEWHSITTTLNTGSSPKTAESTNILGLDTNEENLFTYGLAGFVVDTRAVYMNEYEVWQETSLLRDELVSSISGTNNGIVSIEPVVPTSGTDTIYIKISSSNDNDALTIGFLIDSELNIADVRAVVEGTNLPMAPEFYEIFNGPFTKTISFMNKQDYESPINTSAYKGIVTDTAFTVSGLLGLNAELKIYELGNATPIVTLDNMPDMDGTITWDDINDNGLYRYVLRITDKTLPVAKTRYYQGQFVKQ